MADFQNRRAPCGTAAPEPVRHPRPYACLDALIHALGYHPPGSHAPGDPMTDLTILTEISRRRARDRAPATSARSAPGAMPRPPIASARACTHSLDLSFTARIGTLLVGSVRLSPIRIGGTPALLLGPLTVEPPFRERGIGKALIERALGEAKGTGPQAGRAGRRRALLRARRLQAHSRRGRRRCRGRSIRRGC